MYKNCQTLQSAQRQRLFIERFAALLRVQPYDSITVQQLCQEAEVPRKAFYRYFDSKEDLFDALADQLMLDMIHLSRQPEPPGAPRWDLVQAFSFLLHDRALLEGIAASGRLPRLAQRLMLFAQREDNALEGLAFAQEPGSGEQQLARQFFLGGLCGLVENWADRGFQETPAQMARLTCQLLTGPLFAPK